MPVVPASQEAEAGELLEPGRWRLQWAKIVPLHYSLVIEWDSDSKKEKEKTYHSCIKDKEKGIKAYLVIVQTWFVYIKPHVKFFKKTFKFQ